MILALWTHPRTLSTVFERVMIERGDLEVLHEPFSYLYYGEGGRRQLADMAPDEGHPRSYGEIRDACIRASRTRPVFLKDMAYHCLEPLLADEAFLSATTHTFLVRDPARSIPSHFAIDPGLTLEEVGCEALHTLFAKVASLADESPVVVDADDLEREPEATMRAYCRATGLVHRPEALSWDSGTPPQWRVWESWHRDAAHGGGIEPKRRRYDVDVSNDDRLGALYEHHRPFYEDLRRRRLRPSSSSAPTESS